MSSISLAGVSKHFGAIKAVDSISLDVRQGEFLTILGPSGSGKTTLLGVISGLVDPTGGRIEIGDKEVTWIKPADRNIGLVFQSYALFPHMSVFDNVAFPLTVRNIDRTEIERRVMETLRLVRLEGLEQRRPKALSGGQQQRVALARAVVFRPDILLLDEPLAALDRKLREEVQVELRQLQRSLGITTILVTHDQEEALSLSDRILVLSEGRLQQVAAPEEAYLKPANRFVADFLGTANFLEGTLDAAGPQTCIRLDDGDSVPCAATDTAPGHPVLGVVRPERVQLRSGDSADGMAAKVLDAIYLGQAVRYHLKSESGRPMVAVAVDGSVRFRPGDSVSVSWKPEDVWIIPDSPRRDLTVAS